MLVGLSIAGVDYQLRRYLMAVDTQHQHMIHMFIHIYENYVEGGQTGDTGNAMIYNILLKRYLDLLGTDICRPELKSINKRLL